MRNEVSKINYPLAADSWGWQEKLAILRVMASGRYTMGEEVRAFEEEFAKKFQVEHAVMVNSGSSANLIALAAWKLYNNLQGGEIIVPAVSWSTTYFPITQLGFTPVFVDVDKNFNIDVEHVNDAISDKTVGIMAVNLLGQPCNLNGLKVIAAENNITLFEDNCESLGAFIENAYAGTHGALGTFSFFFSHHLQTMEGGMVVTNNAVLADYMRSLRAHGWVRDLQTDKLYVRGSFPKWEEKYKFILPGYCMRPLEMSAAVGREQLKKMNKFLDVRQANAETFLVELQNYPGMWVQDGIGSSWFGFGVVLPERISRDYVIGRLTELGVETRPIVAGNFLKQPVMRTIKHRVHNGETPNADIIQKQGFYFGNDGTRDLRSKIKQVADVIKSST